MLFREYVGIQLYSNIRITRRERGKLVARPYEGHNIVVNLGRNWLKKIMCVGSYPVNDPDVVEPPEHGETLEAYALDNYKMRFIAVGVGGIHQRQTPPGPGGQTEIVTVAGLEAPVAVKWKADPDYHWMKQVLAQPLTDPLSHVSDTAVRFRCVFRETDISFADQQGPHGTNVPVSEALLLTSAAYPYVPPCLGEPYPGYPGHVDSVPGAVAYNVFEDQPKTPFMTMEIDWEVLY